MYVVFSRKKKREKYNRNQTCSSWIFFFSSSFSFVFFPLKFYFPKFFEKTNFNLMLTFLLIIWKRVRVWLILDTAHGNTFKTKG